MLKGAAIAIAKANSTRNRALKRISKVTVITIRSKTSFASVSIASLRSASGNMLTEAQEVFDVMKVSSEERNSTKHPSLPFNSFLPRLIGKRCLVGIGRKERGD